MGVILLKDSILVLIKVGTQILEQLRFSVPNIIGEIEYKWSVDGIEIAGNSTNSLTYNFPNPGQFLIKVIATDNMGNTEIGYGYESIKNPVHGCF